MKSGLEALFYGNLRPEETILPQNPEYRIINNSISDAICLWKEKLSPDDFDQLEKLLDLRGQSESMYATASFVHGFQLGTLMMMEVCAAKEELF